MSESVCVINNKSKLKDSDIHGNEHSVWSYDAIDEWPLSNKNGQRQSPIPLDFEQNIPKNFPLLKFIGCGKDDQFLMTNNGHSVEIRLKDVTELPTVTGGRGMGTYIFNNIHFHWPAEHTINGKRYPLESHVVTYDSKYNNVSEALESANGIVVLATMYTTKETRSKPFDLIEKELKVISNTLNSPVTVDGIHIEDFLPSNTKNFFTYDGSLTTPNCDEAVLWVVFDNPATIGKDQLKILSNIWTPQGKVLSANNRPLQDINCRKIYYNLNSDANNI